MKIFSKLNTLAALLVAGAAFTACSSDNDITNGNETPTPGTSAAGKEYNLTLGVSNDKISSRALDLGSDLSITATWKPADNIYVYKSDWSAAFGGKLNPTTTANPATVQGTIRSTEQTGELAEGSKINMLFPRTTWDYTGQDGKITTLAQKYDYAIAEGTTITSIDGNNIKETNPNPVFFTAQQAIVRFDFKNGTTPFNVKKLIITDENNKLVASRNVQTGAETTKSELEFNFGGSGLSTAYIALRGVTSASSLTILAISSDNKQYCKKLTMSAALENGKYYAIVFTPETVNDEALTVEAITDGTMLSYDFSEARSGSLPGTVTIKILNSDNTLSNIINVPAIGAGGVILSAGQKALFYGNNDTYTTYEGDIVIDPINGTVTSGHVGNCSISTSSDAYLYNNIMSLIHGEEWATADQTTLPQSKDATFAALFKNAPLKNHPTKALVLPATTLTRGCYQQLLYGTKFEAVPANLLPATTLKEYCYSRMFLGTPLVESPELPAPTLAKGCYNYMFNSCSHLNKITCNARTFPTDANDESVFNSCTANWTQGVADTGTFRMTNPSYSDENIEVADHFAENPTETNYNGIVKVEYMGNNDHVPFTIGTGGIPQHWEVTR